jgi:hypothetical protein
MKIVEVDTTNYKHVMQFLNLPFELYRNNPQWVPPLEIDAKMMLNRSKNPFYKHGDAIFFLAMKDNIPVGRLAVIDNLNYNEYCHEQTGFFYLFECENNYETASNLFNSAFKWIKKRNLDKVIGSKGFTVFDGLGILTKGFNHRPAFGIPYNLSYYPDLIEAVGFRPYREMVSGYLDQTINFPEKIHELSNLVQKRRGLRVLNYKSRKEIRSLIPYFKNLYNSTLTGTEGNSPLTDEDVNRLADQMLWFADPKLIKIVYKENLPVGFLLAYPDISAAVKRIRGKLYPFGWAILLIELYKTKVININGAGMAEGYRGVGGTAILFSEIFKSVAQSRYRFADIVQIGVENENMQREMRDIGIDFYKTHCLYEINL